MRDIAEHLNISVSTVSLALRDDPRLTLETKEQVRSIANDLGYRPDITGALLRTNHPRIIGVAAELTQELHSEYVLHMQQVASEYGYHIVAEDVGVSGGYKEALERLAQFRISDTIVVNPYSLAQVPESLEPSLVIGQWSPWVNTDLVTSSNERGMEELLAHLKEQGYRKVFYLDGPDGISAQVRKNALDAAAAREDIGVKRVAAGNQVDDGYQSVHELMSQDLLPDRRDMLRDIHDPVALICYNDQCAQGAVMALVRSGIRVSEYVAVAGCDNSSIAKSRAFDLTSIDRRAHSISQIAIKRVIERRSKAQIETCQHRVDGYVVIRSSTRRH